MAYQFLYIYLSEYLGYSPGQLSLFSTVAVGLGALVTTFWLLAILQKRYGAKTLSVVPLILSGLLTLMFPIGLTEVALLSVGFAWAVAGSVFAFSFIVGGLSAALLYFLDVTTMLIISGLILISSGLWIKQVKSGS